MQFFEWRTQYYEMKRIAKRDRVKFNEEEIEFYQKALRQIKHFDDFDRPGNAIIAALSEMEWIKMGRPYYKVYPQIASMMSEVSIDIPVKELELPYPVFSILLPDDPENNFHDGGPRLRSMMISKFYAEELEDHQFKVSSDNGGFSSYLKPGPQQTPALFVNISFEGYWKDNPLMFDFTINLARNDTFEERFEESWQPIKGEPDEYIPGKDLWKRILKLAVSTCFFGIDRHEVVLPDLPRRVIEAKSIRHDLREGLQNLTKERNRTDTKKWTIGYEISLPRPIVERPDVKSTGKRELKHGYMRRGHMRWQPFGQGKSGRKLIFIHPHMVREDLPISTTHGYKIPEVSPVRT